jgi:sugar (pentulose or hexulose) kinase
MMGLYLFELVHRALNHGDGKVSYAAMVRQAGAARPFACFLDPNAPEFFATAELMTTVAEYLRSTRQRVSAEPGTIMRGLLEGLAFSCRAAIDDLEVILHRRVARLYVVGGGSRNRLLCQFLANATERTVVAGPAEATVVGNLGIQALATGTLRRPDDIRELAAASFPLVHYTPRDAAAWDRAYSEYRRVCARSNP